MRKVVAIQRLYSGFADAHQICNLFVLKLNLTNDWQPPPQPHLGLHTPYNKVLLHTREACGIQHGQQLLEA